MARKHIVDNTICDVCQVPEETTAHILFQCPNAQQFWSALQIPIQADWPVQALKDIQPPSHIPSKFFGTFLLLCCWHIWKRRNTIIFCSDRTSLITTLAACKSETYLWGARLPKDDKLIATAWCTILASAM